MRRMSDTPQHLFKSIRRGDPAPLFTLVSQSAIDYGTRNTAGLYQVLCFYVSAEDSRAAAALNAIRRHRDRFDDNRFSLFAISNDPGDKAAARVADSLPGVHFLWDFDREVSRMYGVLPQQQIAAEDLSQAEPCWIVLDPTLHVLVRVPFTEPGAGGEALFE